MKVQIKGAFKRYFFATKKSNKKVDKIYMKFSSISNTSVLKSLYSLFQNQHPHFLLLTLFRRISQPSGQDEKITKIKQVGHKF